MKRTLSILVAALFLVSSSAAFAADAPNELVQGMGAKAWRGAVNTVTGFVEIPVQISKGYEKDSFVGGFVGIFTGIWHGVGRTVSGAFELAGFWAADLESNEGMGVPLDAEYAWEKGEHYKLTDPDVQAATLNPMGMKLLRGLGNGLFGVAEIPGHIVKALRTPASEVSIPDLGLGIGIWHALGREIEGASDLATFFLPGPADTKAMKYDEKWPWTTLGTSLEVKG